MRIVATIESEEITEHDDGSVTFRAKAAVDTDGIGPLHGDPDAQRTTSLTWQGKSLNADIDKYIVVPPAIIAGVKGVVLGCQASCFHIRTRKTTLAVVGDIGPHKKLGEVSVATAKALGIDPSPTTGGTSSHVIEYTLYPGKPAVVDGKQYSLQPSGAK